MPRNCVPKLSIAVKYIQARYRQVFYNDNYVTLIATMPAKHGRIGESGEQRGAIGYAQVEVSAMVLDEKQNGKYTASRAAITLWRQGATT